MHQTISLASILTLLFLIPFPSFVFAADAGSLIKCSDFSAVYYLSEDGKRYVFPNEKTYFTWYDDFSEVVTISCDELGDYMIGGNIPYKPGTRMLKLQSAPTVYVVESGAMLRAIGSESQARDLFGDEWALQIDDLSDAFWSTYEVGEPLEEGEVPEANIEGLRPIDDVVVVDEVTASSCAGMFIDSHTHLEGGADGEDVEPEEIANKLSQRMGEHDVGCSVVLNGYPDWQEDLAGEIDFYVEVLEDYPGQFIPFFQLEVDDPDDLTTEALEEALTASEGRIHYAGYGELVFDGGEWAGTSLTSGVMRDLFKFAGENDLVLLLDIASDQGSQLKEMLTEYPDTVVLYQGNHLSRTNVKSWLQTYDNLYFTADVESMMVGLDGFNSYGDEFVDAYDEQYEQWVEDAIATYVPMIEAAPEKVLWGTDVADSFMFGTEEYDRVMDFTQRFLEGLDEEYHDAFLFENAYVLLGGGVTVE